LADLVVNYGNYESELVRINAASISDFDGGDGTFQTGKNYPFTMVPEMLFSERTSMVLTILVKIYQQLLRIMFVS
jgi:hypothetical protein